MSFEDGAGLSFQIGQRHVVIDQRPGLVRDRAAPVVEGLQHVQVNRALAVLEAGDLEQEVVERRRAGLSERQVLLVGTFQSAHGDRQLMAGEVQSLLEVRAVLEDQQIGFANPRPTLAKPQRNGEGHADRPVGVLARRRRRRPAAGDFPGEAVPAVQGVGVQRRQGDVLGLQQALLVGLEDQFQFDEVRAPLLGEFQQFVPILAVARVRRGRDRNDLPAVAGGKPHDVPQGRLAVEDRRLGADQAGAKLAQRHLGLEEVRRFEVADVLLAGLELVRLLGLVDLDLPGPHIQSREHERPVRLDRAAHQFLHRVLELEVRSLRVDAGQDNRSGVDVEAAAAKQRLRVRQFGGVAVAGIEDRSAEAEDLRRILHQVQRGCAAEGVDLADADGRAKIIDPGAAEAKAAARELVEAVAR